MYSTSKLFNSIIDTVNRASIDRNLKKKRKPPEILLTHLMDGIGIALDLKEERMFLTDLGGSVYSAKLNGSDKKRVWTNLSFSPKGAFTDILSRSDYCYVHLIPLISS